MKIVDEKTGRDVFYYRDCWSHVAYNTRVKSGLAWYVHPDQEIRWWKDLERLEVVK